MKPVPILLLEAEPRGGESLRGMLAARGFAPSVAPLSSPDPVTHHADIAVIALSPHAPPEQVAAALERCSDAAVTPLVWGAPAGMRMPLGQPGQCLPPDATPDEIVGRLATLAQYVPLLKRMEREADHMQRLGEQLNRYFAEIDQEMRLAGRLQRDLLPQNLAISPLECSVIFRPATWVSGDMFDAFRIDEHHVGIFIADAMGHGVAAGLVTMFIRQALVTKDIDGSDYRIVTPGEALRRLHESLLRQRLPNCQFVTAAYGILHTTTRELTVARAGHPYPILTRADGSVSEIVSVGGLLGLPDAEAEFEETRTTLRPGDTLLFYTDGIENHLIAGRAGDPPEPQFTPQVHDWARLAPAPFVSAVEQHLDGSAGSLHPEDDITLLVARYDD